MDKASGPSKEWHDLELAAEQKASCYDKIVRAFFASSNMSRNKRLVYVFNAVRHHLPAEANRRWDRLIEKKIKRIKQLEQREKMAREATAIQEGVS